MALAWAAAGKAILRERLVSGRYEDVLYEHCLNVEVDERALRIGPARWISGRPPLEVPLDEIISVYFHANRFAPQVEVLYRSWGGPGAVVFSPHDPRAWLAHVQKLGLLVRPYGVESERLPRRNLSRWLHLGLLSTVGAGGLLALLAAVVRSLVG